MKSWEFLKISGNFFPNRRRNNWTVFVEEACLDYSKSSLRIQPSQNSRLWDSKTTNCGFHACVHTVVLIVQYVQGLCHVILFLFAYYVWICYALFIIHKNFLRKNISQTLNVFYKKFNKSLNIDRDCLNHSINYVCKVHQRLWGQNY